MSTTQVIVTLLAALQDPVTGLRPRAQALAEAQVLTAVRFDYTFGKWANEGALQPAGPHVVTVAPRRWVVNQQITGRTDRDAQGTYAIVFECFATDPAEIQDTLTVHATAVAQVLDRLREYSDATGGTVIDIEDPMEFVLGEFPNDGGVARACGFRCTITLTERSTQ
jgi:hypothetical protein